MTLLNTVDLNVACEAPPPEVRLPACPEVDKLKIVLFLSVMTGSSEGGRHKSRSVVPLLQHLYTVQHTWQCIWLVYSV